MLPPASLSLDGCATVRTLLRSPTSDAATPPATAAIWTSPRGIVTALCMPLVGYLLGMGSDGRWMRAFGFGVAGIAFFGYSHMTLQSGNWDILWYHVNQGMGMSFLFVPLTTLTMS
jgi:hypothetical protein